MRTSIHAARFVAFLCAVFVVVVSSASIQGQQAPVVTVLGRAAEYVGVFMDRFSHVVAEERYVQDLRGDALRTQHRELVADYLLVKTNEQTDWQAFRDVFEVDRVAVRDHGARLEKLFLESPDTALTLGETINRESARYNIGVSRTINSPLLPLALLEDRYRPQFSFTMDKRDRLEGVDVSIVEFQESMRPTLIRGTGGREAPIKGRYWIDAAGRIRKAEIATNDNILQSKITVTFRFDERFQVCVPLMMEEEYTTAARQSTKATAKYDHFREFGVKTEEKAR